MKKILSILIATVLVIGGFSGCGTKNSAYSEEEKQIIKEANQMISNEYEVAIDEDNFSYSVGNKSVKMSLYRWISNRSRKRHMKIL